MGTSRWSPDDWDMYVSKTKGKSAHELFANRKICSDLDPLNFTIRESCDSPANPNSTPIIVAIDDTGSMGMLAENLIREGLGILIEEILNRKPVPDPHVMFMAVGDAWSDLAPLQVTQFETDIRLADQLSKFFIEGNGGGNDYESYNLPWYFAANRTKCDAIIKRKRKGYLFTLGDEPPPPKLLANHVKKFLGDKIAEDIPTPLLLDTVRRDWEVFHILVEEGSYMRSNARGATDRWRKLLGQRAMTLSDYTKMTELIVSTMQYTEGEDLGHVVDSWSGKTALVVRNSLQALAKGRPLGGGTGVNRL